MKSLIFFFAIFLIYGSALAQPDPQRVPPHSRPKPPAAAETLPETEYIPLDAKAVPCQMTVVSAPAIGGVKLGLSPDELSKVFKIKVIPGAPNALEVSSFSVAEKNRSALPKGINEISLAFFNNRLFYAVIAFENASQPKTLDNFALALSDKYSFSRAWFKTAVVNNVYLFCPRELRYELTINDDVQLRMLDLKADNEKNQRLKQNNVPKP